MFQFNSSGKIQENSNKIIIALKSKPERGKANREMMEMMEMIAEYFRRINNDDNAYFANANIMTRN